MKTIEYMKIGLRRRLSATRRGSASLDTNKATLVRRGFTIVELLIVIVVIAILAAISIVVYTGVQERARDAMRMEHGRQISQALQLYALENPKDKSLPVLHGSGCGHNGNGNGRISIPRSGYRPTIDCFVDASFLSEGVHDPLVDPRDSHRGRVGGEHPSYHLQSCWANVPGRTYILMRLENPREEMSGDDITCSNARAIWDREADHYNHFVRVDI